MRHSTIAFTMDTYGHLFPGQESEAAERVSELLNKNSKSMPQPGLSLSDSSALQLAQHSGITGIPAGANGCDTLAESLLSVTSSNPLVMLGLCDLEHPDATEYESSGEGTRTPDTRIMIPLL